MKRTPLSRKSRLSVRNGIKPVGKGGACPPKPECPDSDRARWLASPHMPSRGKPPGWGPSVFEMHGDRCMVTGKRARDGHHIVYAQTLKRELKARVDGRTMRAILADPRNGMPVARGPHDDHHHGVKRIPREALPGSVWEFAADLDRAHETRLTAWLERTYNTNNAMEAA